MARWISGIIMAAGVVLLLLYADVFYIKLLIAVAAAFASWEYLNMAMPTENMATRLFSMLLSGMGVSIFLFTSTDIFVYQFLYLGIFVSFIIQFTKTIPPAEKIHRVAMFALGLAYVVILFGLMGRLLDNTLYQFWLFLVIASTFASDTGGYIFGKNFGKHKLAPKISPGKTIEGVIGGFLFSMIAAFVVRAIFWPEFSPYILAVIAMSITVFGVLGDLCESLIKRGFNVKDSGSLIPGHGGILDRVDGLMFTAPFVYFVSEFY
jgi:phosphatidate cytidylyltransferase